MRPKKKNQKKVLVFKIIAFEPGSRNSHIFEQDSCHWESICYQATVRFKISFRQKFSKPGSLRLLKKMVKVVSSTFYNSLGPFKMLTVKGCSETVYFREWSNQVIESL